MPDQITRTLVSAVDLDQVGRAFNRRSACSCCFSPQGKCTRQCAKPFELRKRMDMGHLLALQAG
jgi:hypothetical protein